MIGRSSLPSGSSSWKRPFPSREALSCSCEAAGNTSDTPGATHRWLSVAGCGGLPWPAPNHRSGGSTGGSEDIHNGLCVEDEGFAQLIIGRAVSLDQDRSQVRNRLVWAFYCQGAFPRGWAVDPLIVLWVLLTVLCSERERPFFVPSPAIRFPERAEGGQGTPEHAEGR